MQPAPAVRAAAFTLFGTLSRFGSGPSEGPFFEQIQTNFVSLLLHLNESDPVVVVVSCIIMKRSLMISAVNPCMIPITCVCSHAIPASECAHTCIYHIKFSPPSKLCGVSRAFQSQ